MKIGELAKLTDTQVETVRYYEREGLLPAPARSDGNYRLYTQAHVERLSFIRNCRSLDMTLEEIRSLLSLRDSPQDQCESVNALIDELNSLSPEFRAWWPDTEVKGFDEGQKRIRQSDGSLLEFIYVALAPLGRPNLSLVTYLPRPRG